MSTTADINAALEASQDARDKTLVIRQVTSDIMTFSTPFTRFATVPLGGRSTAIRLPSSDLFIYASTPLTSATKGVISRLGGQVKYLVTPDGEHGMFIQEYVDAYPGAKAISVERMKDKKPDIKWAGLFGAGGETQKYGFEPDITLHQVAAHANHELVAIHHPTGTLLEADMIFNLPPNEQYSRAGGLPTLFKYLGGGSSLSPDGFVHQKAVAAIVKDKDLIKKELQAIKSANWDRLIPCHGDVIETGGKNAWNTIWGQYE